MGARTAKLKTSLAALGTFIKNVLTMQFPLWLYIVAFLVCVLFTLFVGCTASKVSVQTALVGYTEYRGHSFLVFSTMKSDPVNGSFSVVHDPDCKCHYVEPLIDSDYGFN